MRPLIVIGSTDRDYFGLLAHILEKDAFETVFAGTIEEIVRLGAECRPHAIILDSTPGTVTASDVCGVLKSDRRTDEILRVALIRPGDGAQYIELSNIGIHESFLRPLSPGRLIEFLLAHPQISDAPRTAFGRLASLRYAGIEINMETRRVRRDGVEIHLGRTEFNLLHHLVLNSERVCGRPELILYAWPAHIHVEARTVNVHIGRLRKALKGETATDLIRTVRSLGYVLDRKPIA